MRRLLIRPGAIGDCILSFPALEHLKEEYTEVWVPRAVVPLVQFANRVRPIAETGLDLMAIGDLEIPAPLETTLKTFDSIVSWHGAARPEFRAALRRVQPKSEFYSALPPANYLGHATDFFCEQVGAPCGLIPRIQTERSLDRNTIVIHPFSGGRKKNWPLKKFQALAQRLALPIEWTAGPEEELADAVRFDNLADLARWLCGARLYIGNDSGITHLATAAGIQTLALFGPIHPAVWGPRGENVKIMRADPLSDLNVDQVAAAANRLLASR